MDHQQVVLDRKNKIATYTQYMKKVTKFLVSFSLFSFLFSNPCWVSFFFDSSITHLANLPSQFLFLANHKSYVFLLCNGILVFLAKYSTGMINNTPEPENNLEDEFFENNDEINLQQLNALSSTEETEEDGGEGESKWLIVKEEETKEEAYEEEIDHVSMGEEKVMVDEEYTEKGDSESEFALEEEEEDDHEEGGIGRMSTEELNRKFEEFIRKMKEEIRIEAQRHLIMV